MKLITIIICTYNRAKYLELALKSLVEQTFEKERFDVIVVDNNSTDNTREIVNKYSNKLFLKYFFEKNQGTSYARNRGIKESNTKFIGYLEDDAKASKNWIKNTYKIIQNKNPKIFGGPIYTYYEAQKPKWFQDESEVRKITNTTRCLAENEFLSGANMFFKKEIFDLIGLFDVDLGVVGNQLFVGEETRLQIVAKEKNVEIYYSPELFVYHFVPEHKMKIVYMIKRSIASDFTSRRVFGEKRFGIWRDCVRLAINFFKASFCLLKYPFRNKKQCPHFKNYFVEIIFPYLSIVGRIYSYFKY